MTVTVSDEDGGTSDPQYEDLVLNYTIVGGGILQPINPGPPTSIFKSKSTIPIKIKVQDCDLSYPGDLAPTIKIYKMIGNTPDGEVAAVESTSSADTGTTMRFTGSPDYQYIYNLAAKKLTDASAGYQIEITIPATGQKIIGYFGLKP